jgi:hypothetical protein
MEYLTEYLDKVNQFRALLKHKPYDLNNPQDRDRLADKLEADLSPENLTCDGELARSEVDRRYRYLTRVQKQLEALERHEALHALYKKS